jgi:hypothetical protein
LAAYRKRALINACLTSLGVPAALQDWFKVTGDPIFDYDGAIEPFDDGFHKVPTTANLWLAGHRQATGVVITHSAMEAIAYLT